MKELLKEAWSFTLYEDDKGKLLLEVMIGSLAMYELKYELPPEDVAAYREEGAGYIKRLVRDIQENPSNYQK